MIDLRRPAQRTFGEWMRQADQVLEDEQLVNAVSEALLKRSPKSRTRGRRGAAAEIVLRMLLLKHIRNWSFAEFEREVRPTACTGSRAHRFRQSARWPRRSAARRRRSVVQGRKMRVDTTVVETDIHYLMSSQGWRIAPRHLHLPDPHRLEFPRATTKSTEAGKRSHILALPLPH